MPRRTTTHLVVHCSATRPVQDIGAREIRKWHVEGNGWSDIGYHFVIRRNGLVEKGRPLANPGSHVKGLNHCSVGVCLVGGVSDNMAPEDNFTALQMRSLRQTLTMLLTYYPNAKVVGHRDVIQPGSPPKACPSFDVKSWWATPR